MNRIFLLAGQSNMAGRAEAAAVAHLKGSLPDNVRLFEDGEWRDLLWRDHFGPEIGFAMEISKVFPSDQIILCKVARGGANLFYDWNPDGISQGNEDQYRGPLYPKLMSAFGLVKAQIELNDESCECSGMLWMQGERDSVFEFMAQSYHKNLRAFIGAVRKDMNAPGLPVVLGKIAPRVHIHPEKRLKHAFRDLVLEAQKEISLSDHSCDLVETADLPQSDNLHFNAQGQLELGKRFAAATARAIRRKQSGNMS